MDPGVLFTPYGPMCMPPRGPMGGTLLSKKQMKLLVKEARKRYATF